MNKLYLVPLVLVLFTISASSASIRPFITTSMPSNLNVDLKDVPLHWYIVDDNPRNYSLFINSSPWKINIPMKTNNSIDVTFSNTPGIYNVSLIVEDYSGYTASAFVVITIYYESATTSSAPTSISTSSITHGSASSSSNSAASSGFDYLEVVGALTIIIVAIRKKGRNFRRR